MPSLAEIEVRLKKINPKQTNQFKNFADCMDELLALPPSEAQFDLIKNIVTVTILKSNRDLSGLHLYYSGHWARLINHLAVHDKLSYDVFKQSIWREPQVAQWLGVPNREFANQYQRPYLGFLDTQLHGCFDDEYFPRIIEYAKQLAWEVAQDLSGEARAVFQEMKYLEGSRFLLLGGKYHAELLPDEMKFEATYKSSTVDSYRRCIANMWRYTLLEPMSKDEEAAFITQLRELPQKTLQAMFVQTGTAHTHIAEVLGWSAAVPLVKWIKSTANKPFERDGYSYYDVPNTPDPESGTIDLIKLKQCLETAGEDLVKEICKLFRKSGENVKNTLTLIEAAAGWNTEKIQKSFQKHGQIAIKAYGLLPLERGEDEIFERYMALKQSAKDGKKFGQIRRTTHAGAVQAAINNLAQLAGYKNSSRFEWAMEAKIAEEVAPPGRQWTIDDYEMTLELEGVDVSLAIVRNDKRLKSVPKAVRASDEYKEAKEIVGQLRAQASRLRKELFEDLIATGEMLSVEEFKNVLRLPIAHDLCQRLIWRTPDGKTGLLDTENIAVIDLDGNPHPVEDKIGLAHSFHLCQNDTLAAWQREIVRRRLVQPVKQAFRELYILTPAERETRTFSNRFAGHAINGGTASRLLTGRGWHISNIGEAPTPIKIYGDIQAIFGFSDSYYYLSNNMPIGTDRIYFTSYPQPNLYRWDWNRDGENNIPLEDIPPLVFSEVMRDADLVVSVAQREGQVHLSRESYDQRGNLVKTLLDDLDLAGVEVKEHFAYIKGKLADYRVHLGSAVIHIEPGNYLCIVPAGWGMKHEKLFLPFVDEKDSKISEVISKILFLLADDKIKDHSILRQIKRKS